VHTYMTPSRPGGQPGPIRMRDAPIQFQKIMVHRFLFLADRLVGWLVGEPVVQIRWCDGRFKVDQGEPLNGPAIARHQITVLRVRVFVLCTLYLLVR
jgi:hypothetical protein